MRCAADHLHANKLSAHYCDLLSYKKKENEILGYSRNISLRVRDEKLNVVGEHKVDFLVLLNGTGRQEAHEIVVGKPKKSKTRELFTKTYDAIHYYFITIKGNQLWKSRYPLQTLNLKKI